MRTMTHLSKYFAGSSRMRVRPLWAAAAFVPLLGACVTYVQPAPTAPLPQADVAEEAQDAAPVVTAQTPPPPLPVYEQPPLPEPGYLWTPGYWNYGPAGYYWIPGTWVMPPRVGVLWTPGYWGFVSGVYLFHAGYWGPHVGFYGGVNYGGGYVGEGYHGGRWENNHFAYNTSVTNVNTTIVHNTYNETVINNTTVNRVSYNGGAGGVHAVATPADNAAMHERHVAPTHEQAQHFQAASQDRTLQANVNQGHPPIAATPHPGAFDAPGVVAAHGAGPHPYSTGAVPPAGPGAAPNTHPGNPAAVNAAYQPAQHGAPGSAVPPGHAPQGQPHAQMQGQVQSHGQGQSHGQAQPHGQPQPQGQPHGQPQAQQVQPHGQPQPQAQPQVQGATKPAKPQHPPNPDHDQRHDDK
jgi:hypothetical protein